MILSNNFPGTDVRLIGLKFSGSFLKIAVTTLALFHISGSLLSCNDFWKMILNGFIGVLLFAL